MKKLLFISVLFSSLFLSACKEKEDTPQPTDNISYHIKNKTLLAGETYTYRSGCFNYYFTIDTTNTNDIHVYGYSISEEGCIGDGSIRFLASVDSTHFKMLETNTIIGAAPDTWKIDTLYLDHFANKGKKYIGVVYHQGSSTPEDIYHYGWVGVELSADKQTLKFIDAASNCTMGRPIKAGQKK